MRELVAGTSPSWGAAQIRAGNDGARTVRAVPADGLLHPAALLALGLLVLNDHVLKHAWPGLLTGKLSDLSGLVVFPLLVVGVMEVAWCVIGRWHGPSSRLVTVSVIATLLVFGLVKTVPAAHELYEAAWGFLQWLPTGLAAAVSGGVPGAPWQVNLVADPTDLLCLPAGLIPLWIGWQRATRDMP